MPCVSLSAGKVYDLSGTYTAVFLTVGGVYIVATLAFGAIPLIQRRRERLYGSSSQDDMNGATQFETFHISTKRSTSKSSLQISSSVGAAAGSTGFQPISAPTLNGGDSTGCGESSAALASAYGAIVAGQQSQYGGGGKSPIPDPHSGVGRGGQSSGVGLTQGVPPYHSMNYD